MTMKLIETKTLGTAAASIEFTSIPQTFTDLLVVASTRNNTTNRRDLDLSFNGVATDLSSRGLYGDGAGGSSLASSEINPANVVPGPGTTANTFGSYQAYIPNYTSSAPKSVSIEAVGEDNATTILLVVLAGLWNVTDAITSIKLNPEATSFVAGTTISLYGVLKGSDGIVTTS